MPVPGAAPTPAAPAGPSGALLRALGPKEERLAPPKKPLPPHLLRNVAAVVVVAAVTVGLVVGLRPAPPPEAWPAADRAALTKLWLTDAKVRRDAGLEARLQAVLDAVSRALADETHSDLLSRRVVVQDDAKHANAFLLPDGTEVVTVAMLSLLQNEAQLAALFAHMLAHDRRGHITRVLDTQSEWVVKVQRGLQTLAGTKSPDRDIALVVAAAGAKAVSNLREEQAVDPLVLRVMSRAGFDATEMRQLFALVTKSKSPWLGSHADLGNRSALFLRAPSGGRIGKKEYDDQIRTRLGPAPRPP